MKVNKKFLDDFNLVIKHYEFTKEEIEDAKRQVRDHYETAKEGYKYTADCIRFLYPEPVEESGILITDITLNPTKKEDDKKSKSKSNKRRI